ncbi:MAG: class I SAM-dependent methyltransferase [Candidatus Dormibacteria bacterium]
MPDPIIPFTAHNIRLGDGSCTRPNAPLTADEPVTRAVMRTLDLLFPSAQRRGTTVVDLGCLEGGYAVEFARAGFEVTGLEARRVNLERCQFVAAALDLPNLHFVRDDARNLGEYPPFDVVFCSGLLYHLDRPAAYLNLLAARTRRLLILQTHYALPDRTPPDFALSELTTHEGYQGRWYREFADEVAQDDIEASNWSSYGNPRSFWLERTNLLQALRDSGFDIVYEQLDFVTNNVTDHYIQEQHRSLFLALRL